MTPKIYNNFLEDSLFQEMYSLFFSNKFSWFFIDNMTEKDHYFFTHNFYDEGKIHSVMFDFIIKPFIEKLNIKHLHKAKANLMLKEPNRYESNYHTDLNDDKLENSKTAIFYINTCDGHTVFKEDKLKIKSKENTLVVFDAFLKHKAVSQLDTVRRMVININYI